MRKPMLSVDQLITHMQEKGIKFEIMSEADAKQYLHMNNNYFKLTSYRKNYPKYTTGAHAGTYEHLDFAYSWIWCWLHRCPLLATIHGETLEEVKGKPYLMPLFAADYFRRFLLIKGKGEAQLFNEKGEVMV